MESKQYEQLANDIDLNQSMNSNLSEGTLISKVKYLVAVNGINKITIDSQRVKILELERELQVKSETIQLLKADKKTKDTKITKIKDLLMQTIAGTKMDSRDVKNAKKELEDKIL